jgi:uncharacterized protein with HEPN domain
MAILAIERCFTIIGEAAGKMPQYAREKYPEIPWGQIVGFRNIVVHDYNDIDYIKMWNTIKNDIPQNIVEIERMLEMGKNETPV